MDAAALSDPLAPFALHAEVSPTRAPAVAEVHALREVDLVGPAEWLEAPQDATLFSSGEIRAGDELRVPPPALRNGQAMQAAIGRVLRVDAPDAAGAEATLRRLLGALHHANREIRHLGAK